MRFTKLKKTVVAVALFSLSALVCFAQTKPKPTPQQPMPVVSSTTAIKSSPAFAEILLRKTELEATLDDLTVQFTDEYPKVKETRFALGLIRKEFERILAVADAAKLTPGLGKLILRKVELEIDLWALRQKYNEEHEEVKRVRRKVATFEKAIKEILL
jgi:hypothetical protein